MRFESQFTIESKLFPGVRITVRRLNQVQRARLEFELLPHRVRYSDLVGKLEALPKEPEPPTVDPDRIERGRLALESTAVLNAHFKPPTIRTGFIAIEGADLNGSAFTADSLIEHGDSALIDEVWIAIEQEAVLSAAQTKNLQSPSTSAALEGGESKPTNAVNVSKAATT